MALILLVGLSLRLAGLSHGLPLILFRDEAQIISRALSINRHDLNPHIFVWGSLHYYLLKAALSAYAHAHALIPGGAAPLPRLCMAARLLSVGLSLLTIVLVYALGRLLSGGRAGLLGAALFAVSPLAVETSHYGVVESQLGAWSALSLIGLVLWRTRDRRAWMLAASCAGLAVATKYNAVALLLPIAVAAVARALAAKGGLSAPRLRAFGAVLAAGAAISLGLQAFRAEVLNHVATWTNSGSLDAVYVRTFDRIREALALVLLAGGTLAVAAYRRVRWASDAVRAAASPELWAPLLLALAFFLLAEPFALLDFPAFAQGFFFSFRKQALGGAESLPVGARLFAQALKHIPTDRLFYVRALWNEWGACVFLCIGIGLFALRRARSPMLAPFLSMLGFLLLSSSSGHYYAVRYLFPAWPLLA
ncbi:MAG TPA: glycosyltransferase family 39 protein, partial [Elusimicrobiota bacterium]|nr:glycosyltransferase family 39 protein [Elusimicrobiota bacterium]